MPQVFAYLDDSRAETYHVPKDLWASLRYAIQYEMALTPVDFFLRRTSDLLFDIQTVSTFKGQIVQAMADLLSWTEEEMKAHQEELDEQIRLLTLTDI